MLMSIYIIVNFFDVIMATILFVHFGDLESLYYQTSVLYSLKSDNDQHIFDLLYNQPLNIEPVHQLFRNMYEVPDGFREKRALRKKLKQDYDIVVNVYRDAYKESLAWIKRIKAPLKIGYNIRRSWYNGELSKEKKDHMIDHYLKACDILNIPKIRKISDHEIQNKDESNRILIHLTQWPLEKLSRILSIPLMRFYHIDIVENNEAIISNFKSWNPINRIQLDQLNLAQVDIVITDQAILKTRCDAMACACIYLSEKSQERKAFFPIYRKSYAITPRLENQKIDDIETDAVIQALHQIIEDVD